MKVLSNLMLHDVWKSIAFWRFPDFVCVLQVRVAYRWRLVWSNSGMIMTGGKLTPQCHYRHHKSHMDWPGMKPGNLWWEADICGEKLMVMTWPLKCEILLISVQNSVPTSQRTNPVCTTKLMWLRDILIVDSQNHIKKKCEKKMQSLKVFKCHVIWYI